jgi:hypothetical protein
MRYGLGRPIAAAARALALSSLFVVAHVASWAWGDLGHKIICEIALSRVKPATRSEIDKLMRTDTEFSSFSDACVWPDHPRKRASEHFLNLPRDSLGLTENDCGGATACVVTARRFAIGEDTWQRREVEFVTSLEALHNGADGHHRFGRRLARHRLRPCLVAASLHQ